MPGLRDRIDCRARVIAAANDSKMRDIATGNPGQRVGDSEDESEVLVGRKKSRDFAVPEGFYLSIEDDDGFCPTAGPSVLGEPLAGRVARAGERGDGAIRVRGALH